MIHFGQYADSERPDSDHAGTPRTNPVNKPERQRPPAARVAMTGRRPEAAA